MIEKQIEQYLVKRVKDIGGRAYKFVSPGNAGVPDRLVCLPGGHTTFVEMKGPSGKLTALQEVQIRKLDKLGHTTFILNSTGAVDGFIRSCVEMMGDDIR
jgi:hypothetical protein